MQVSRAKSTYRPPVGQVHENLKEAEPGIVVAEMNGGQCKTYLVADTRAGRAALVDPVLPKLERYLGVLGYLNCRLDYCVETHTHADHITASKDLQRITGTEVAMHHQAPAPYVTTHFGDGDVIRVGGVDLKALHTPGHTPDSASLHGAGRVFTGDALLIGGTGRTDFAGGDAGHSFDSITTKIFALPDDTIVLPAHDYRGNTESTVGLERQFNPRLAGKTREEYVEVMSDLGLPLPEKIMEALQTNVDAVDDTSSNIPQYSQLARVHTLSPSELASLLSGPHGGAGDVVVVDVREGHEVEGGGLPTIPGAINLPVRQLPQAWEQLEAYRDRHIVCVCRAGVRSATATALLHGLGFERVSNLSGGLLALASPPSLDDPRLESVPAVEPAQLRAMVERGERPLVLDVREPEEFEGELGHIEGSELVPLRFVPERAQGLARRARDEGRAVVVVCRSGRRSAAAVASLGDAGVGALNLTGGMLAWNRESAQ